VLEEVEGVGVGVDVRVVLAAEVLVVVVGLVDEVEPAAPAPAMPNMAADHGFY
jgi:hypothetical protein